MSDFSLLFYVLLLFCNFPSSRCIKDIKNLFKSKLKWDRNKNIDWLDLTVKSFDNVDRISRFFNIDISAGAGALSTPSTAFVEQDEDHLPFTSIILPTKPSPILRVHRLGKKVLKFLPEPVLLGILGLIGLELLQREVNTKSRVLPPLVQELANTTAENLENKLEVLSALSWDVDPFIKAEIENLQTQPLEVLDRYVAKELLPLVDRELSPLLTSLIADPKRVSLMTRTVKDFFQLCAILLVRPGERSTSSIDATTASILTQVESVGQSVEDAIHDWNRVIEEFRGAMKSESFSHFLLPTKALVENTNTTSISSPAPSLFILPSSKANNNIKSFTTVSIGEAISKLFTPPRTVKRPWAGIGGASSLSSLLIRRDITSDKQQRPPPQQDEEINQ